jgi:hypothetical protein
MARTKAALRKRLNNLNFGLVLSRDLFGDVPDCDFELAHYVGFLDRVGSRNDLVRGLKELDPFVDDALTVAEAMTEEDFRGFKTALVLERNRNQDPDSQSIIPAHYHALLIPERFIPAKMIADRFATTLEVALLRIVQNENGI